MRRLQMVMNGAGRMVIGCSKYEHITVTPVLRDILHWLPVPQQIQFKIAFLASNCIRDAGPAYFQHVCIPTANLSGQAGLRSAERGDVVVPRTATELGKRSFGVVAPVTRNSLSEHLRLSPPSPKDCFSVH